MKNLQNKKFILWGTGSLGKRIYSKLLLEEFKITVDFIVDGDIQKDTTMFLDKKIVHSSKLPSLVNDNHCIVICSSFEQEILGEIKKMNLSNEIDVINANNFEVFLNYIKATAKVDYYDSLKVIVGAANTSLKEWISTDVEFLNILDINDWKSLFGDKRLDAIFAEHVWEHLTLEQGTKAIGNCFEYLKPGGVLRLAVPDGNNPNENYINTVKVNGFGVGADDHKVLYTYESLKQALEKYDFKVVEGIEYYNAEGTFVKNYMDINYGLVRRSDEYDDRNWRGNRVYTSLIIDAVK